MSAVWEEAPSPCSRKLHEDFGGNFAPGAPSQSSLPSRHSTNAGLAAATVPTPECTYFLSGEARREEALPLLFGPQVLCPVCATAGTTLPAAIRRLHPAPIFRQEGVKDLSLIPWHTGGHRKKEEQKNRTNLESEPWI